VAVLAVASSAVRADFLADLFQAALESDPSRSSTEAQFRASGERVKEARASILPSVAATGSASTTAFQQYGGTADVTNFRTDQWALQVTQPLFRPALVLALSEAQAQRDAAQAQLDSAELDLLVRLVTAYFDVLTAREVWLSLRGQKLATLQQLAAARRALEVGTGSRNDVNNAEAKHDLIVGQERSAENDLMLKREALQQMVGSTVLNLRVLPRAAADPEPSQLGLPWLLDQAHEQNPLIEQARQALRAASLDVRKANRDHYPTVDLSMSYGAERTNGTPTSPFPVHGKTAQAQVNLNLPLFAGFGTVAKVREAAALEDKARADLEGAERTVTTNVREAYFSEQSSLAQIASFLTAEKSTRAAVESNRKGYLVGTSSNTDVLNAESEYFQAYRDLMKAKLDAWLNHVKLQIIVGFPWRDGIDAFDHLLVGEPPPPDEDQVAQQLAGLVPAAEAGDRSAPQGIPAIPLKLVNRLQVSPG
jgi:outer membrane protein